MVAPNESNETPELISGPMEITISELGNPKRRRKQDGPGALVRTTGLTKLNRGGTNLLDGLAKSKGLALDTYKLKLGSNAKTGFVALYPVDPNTSGAVAIARDKRYKLITVYLHELFDDVDGLAPTEDRKCIAATGTDMKGNTCVLIGLKSALEKHTRATGTTQSKAPKTQNQ